MGTCDAFVRVRLGRQTRTTAVARNTYQHAVWAGEAFELEVGLGDGAERDVLRLELFDHNRLAAAAKTEEPIGTAQVTRIGSA